VRRRPTALVPENGRLLHKDPPDVHCRGAILGAMLPTVLAPERESAGYSQL